MKYRRLGNTNLTVSVVGMGTFQFGGTWGKHFSQPEVDAIIDEGRQAGINLIDTAECYGDHLAEKMIGPAIRADRERWIVAFCRRVASRDAKKRSAFSACSMM